MYLITCVFCPWEISEDGHRMDNLRIRFENAVKFLTERAWDLESLLKIPSEIKIFRIDPEYANGNEEYIEKEITKFAESYGMSHHIWVCRSEEEAINIYNDLKD